LVEKYGFVPSVAAMYDEKVVTDLKEWVKAGVKPWKSIVRSNVKKKRFTKIYPEVSREILEEI
jgi:hypothetical protein